MPVLLISCRSYLREFYSKALQWLANPSQTTFKITSVFIWSMASWDVLGIYPESTTPSQGSYRDPQMAEAIAAYNKGVSAAQEQACGGKFGPTSLTTGDASSSTNSSSFPQDSAANDGSLSGAANSVDVVKARAAVG